MDKILIDIKSLILDSFAQNNADIEKIILFGSRAGSDYTADSDYDILIVTKTDLERNLKYKISNEINKKAAKMLVGKKSLTGIDLIIRSSSEIDFFKDKIGSVTNEAYSEGIAI